MRALFWIAFSCAVALPAYSEPAPSLTGAFAEAWARQPAARGMAERERAARARRSAADALTPEPPSVEVGTRTDRFNRDRGAADYDLGVAIPLWLPGERSSSQAVADADVAAQTLRAGALRLQLASDVRQAWWEWQLVRNELVLAGERVDAARRLREDVARRVRAGDLAKSDQHQAEGALALAEALHAEAKAALESARFRLQALTGQPAPDGAPQPEPEVPESNADALLANHPRLLELAARGDYARQSLALVRARGRASPELAVGTRRERSAAGEAMEQTWAVSVRIPLSSTPRQDARLADANAELIEVSLGVERERERLAYEAAAARSRLTAARAQLAANLERARLAGENRGFFDKSFRLGETDLPTRLRIEQEAFEAERQLSRARINVAQSLSAYRQALGLLPE